MVNSCGSTKMSILRTTRRYISASVAFTCFRPFRLKCLKKKAPERRHLCRCPCPIPSRDVEPFSFGLFRCPTDLPTPSGRRAALEKRPGGGDCALGGVHLLAGEAGRGETGRAASEGVSAGSNGAKDAWHFVVVVSFFCRLDGW